MSYRVEVNASGAEIIKDAFELFSDESKQEANRVGIAASLKFIRDYHFQFNVDRRWENLGLPTHGAGRKSTGFGRDIVDAWSEGEITADGASMTNNMPLLPHKITGGTIRAKRASALTIPVVPEAHGVKAADYPNRLFKPKGKDVLLEKVGDSEIRAVYVLRRSVNQAPVQGLCQTMRH